MPTVTLIQGDDGRLVGLTDRDQRAFMRFVKRIKNLVGSCITFEWREPRSGPYHRRFFAILGAAFEAQERFEDVEQFRMWLTTGAGFCDFLPHPTQGVVAIPKSIAYASLDETEFREVAGKIWAFYHSQHAREILYPHLSESESYEMVMTVLEQFE